jgi:hypothetical protein
MPRIRQDDIVAKVHTANLVDAALDVQPRESEIDLHAVRKLGRTIVHETMTDVEASPGDLGEAVARGRRANLEIGSIAAEF